MNSYKIKDIPKSDRPREKLVKKGAMSLKDEELLAILLRSGYKSKNVIKLAKYFLDKYPLTEFLRLNFEELMKLKGIGPAKATAIRAVAELCRRVSNANNKTRVKIDNPKDVFTQIADLCSKKQEHLVVLFLDRKSVV